MNKLVAFLMAVTMCVGFSSCSSKEKNLQADTDIQNESSNEEITETTTEASTECNHEWKEATCKSPKTCKICGEIEGETSDHSTHKGKCESCGEYILDKAFIPDFKDFTACVGLSEVPSDFTLSSTSPTDTGFDAYFGIPADKRIESCENLGWDISISYTGTADFNIISTYIMNYVPTNQDDLDELYEAIINEYEKKLGTPTADKWLHSTGEAELRVYKAHNGVSVFIKFTD